MAGGVNAKNIVCPTCLYQAGQIVVAERTNEGQETDWYLCEQQHKSGISWDGEELPSQPLWPASQKDKQTAQNNRGQTTVSSNLKKKLKGSEPFNKQCL